VEDRPLVGIIRAVDDIPLLYCAPATIDLAGAEIELVPMVAREGRLARALSSYDESQLDYILIDCPPSLGLLTVNALTASTHGVIRLAPVAAAGPLLSAELEALGRALERPKRPMLAIVGGSKVSTKLALLDSLLAKVDQLIVGGGIANTFLLAAGHPIGNSLAEPDLVDAARKVLQDARQRNAEIPLPTDVVVANAFSANAAATVKPADHVGPDEMILDVGPETAQRYADMIAGSGTVIWNGPVGVFEFDAFAQGTETVARAIARSGAFSLAGGGDTLAAIDKYGVGSGISYISTGGGAFLEFLQGETLPAVAALEARGSR